MHKIKQKWHFAQVPFIIKINEIFHEISLWKRLYAVIGIKHIWSNSL